MQTMTASGRRIRALLIQPPHIGCTKMFLSHMDDTGGGIGFKPPLGLLYIATFLKERTPHHFKVIDAQAQKLDFDACLEQVSIFKPDVVGISSWTDWWYSAYHLGRMIKERFPHIVSCYGGPHISIYPEETLSLEHVDSVIVGDGEMPFASLCNMVANNSFENNIAGLHFKKFGIKEGQKRTFIQGDLDELPAPDRAILPLHNYTSVLCKSGFATTMVTSRGCPFNCTYCRLKFQKPIFRSAENIIDEFKRIYELGIKEVEVYDDTFTLSKDRVIAICQALIDKKIKIEWAVRDRVNFADPGLLDIMKKAGCKRVHYGIESGVDRVLQLMKKNITTEQAKRAVKLAKNKKYTILTYYMFGNRGESIDDIRRTITFALELKSDYAQFSITVPYPGTEMYSQAMKDGVISHDYWREFALCPKKDFAPPQFIEENVTLSQLVDLRDEAIRLYYFRWRFIIREFLRVKSWSEFIRKLTMGLHLAFGLVKKARIQKENRN